MASGGKRKGAGERVLESRHVIGLFMLMLLFSGIFFTLGFLMGRDRYDGQVRAEGPGPKASAVAAVAPKSSPGPKHGNKSTSASPAEAPSGSAPPAPEWDFYNAGKTGEPDDQLKPAPAARTVAAKSNGPARVANNPAKGATTAAVSGGSYTVQVAALRKAPDAMHLAKKLQNKKFPAFVVSPKSDKYYRVRVGPFADQKSAEAAKKNLEAAGFKAIVKH